MAAPRDCSGASLGPGGTVISQPRCNRRLSQLSAQAREDMKDESKEFIPLSPSPSSSSLCEVIVFSKVFWRFSR